MTTFRVEATSRAKRELREAAAWIAVDAPESAERWVHGFWTAIESLKSFPRRCGLAQEQDSFAFELRQMLYGHRHNYRAVFTIREETVVVLAIRHAKQADLSPDDL